MLTPNPKLLQEKDSQFILLFKRLFFYTLLLSIVSTSCTSLRIPPKKVGFFVRDATTGNPIPDLEVKVVSPQGDTLLKTSRTDGLGYLELKQKDLTWRNRPYDLHRCQAIGTKVFQEGNSTYTVSESINLNNYQHYYDWYLDSRPPDSRTPQVLEDSQLVADMHYHVSMRVQNLFGTRLYGEEGAGESIPENINWYKDLKKLKVLYKGRWKKPYIGPIDEAKVADSKKWQKRREQFASLIHNKFVRPPKGSSSNYLTHYTQATNPHMKQGQVGLAFNAISPFEHSVSNTGGKRMVSNALVTGAPLNWLRRIGWKKHPLTHWENFNLEYATIRDQSRDINNFHWRFFEEGVDLKDNIPTVISVVEGSHVLQHKFFPHEFDYNLENRSDRHNKDLFNRTIEAGALREGTYSKAIFEEIVEALEQAIDVSPEAKVIINSLKAGRVDKLTRSEWRELGITEKDTIEQYIDRLLHAELEQNIDSLKRMDGPPIMMVTIGHLTYNGMVGHAPNLDGGKFPTNVVAQKNYNIRVSDDPTYKKQWSGVFFTIPGLNKFGKQVMEELVSTDNGHRIFIDLKHSDFSTRKYFFEKIMYDTILTNILLPKDADVVADEQVIKDYDIQILQKSTEAPNAFKLTEDLISYDTLRIPPICSHCCVTGLPSDYASPLNDEYALLRSPSTTIFNPFAINLFDEEIAAICQNEGIIGISLEQRVLGGYINKQQVRNYKVKRNGDIKTGSTFRNKRWKNVRRLFRHYLLHDPLLIKTAIDYTRDSMGVPEGSKGDQLKRFKKILKITHEDYISVAPFLANLFHIIDHSGIAPKDTWDHVSIGSDLDGLIDPINICATAGQYPFFKTRLRQFIPVFLKIRAQNDPTGKAKPFAYYFNDDISVDEALNKLFYQSLRDFSNKYFNRSLDNFNAKTNPSDD